MRYAANRAGVAALLAASLSRFQRIQQVQSAAKVGVHACKSSEARTGEESRGVDLEQLSFYEKGQHGLLKLDPV